MYKAVVCKCKLGWKWIHLNKEIEMASRNRFVVDVHILKSEDKR